MALHWIKVEKSTARKPEILAISSELGIHLDHAFGLCVRFWCWCDDQMTDGNTKSVTSVTLDCVFGQVGFVAALAKVGWIVIENDGISIPNWDRHLSKSAKKRDRCAERVQKHRVTQKSYIGNANVTAPLILSNIPFAQAKGTGRKPKTTDPSVAEIIVHYQTFHPQSHPGVKERSKIAARLKDGYSVDQLKCAIDGCHNSPYHCGENKSGTLYQSLELIVRDSSHVNQFIELANAELGPVLSEKTKLNLRSKESYLKQRMEQDSNGIQP